MYQVIGLSRVLSAYGVLVGIFLAGLALAWPPADPQAWWRSISLAAALAAGGVWVMGQTPVFPWLCRLPFARNYLADIDGEWEGALTSNWPAIAAREGIEAPEGGTKSVEATITIKARLFFVRVNLNAKSGYSTSKTMCVRACRDEEDGSLRLYYVYQNETAHPLATDTGQHYGAAFLDAKREGEALFLEGQYWTNRNWHRAMNTAGTLRLARPAPSV